MGQTINRARLRGGQYVAWSRGLHTLVPHLSNAPLRQARKLPILRIWHAESAMVSRF